MNSTWALRRHVSETIMRLLCARHGALAAWPRIRWIWLSGAMDSRQPMSLEPRAASREGIDPEAPVHRVDDGSRN